MDTPIDVDEDSQWKHDSEFVKIIKNMYGTCGTRPGWRCRRRWAWLRGLWHIWDHSQSISLEKLDIKHVPYMFLMILTNSLSCFHWLSSSTSMGVSMTPNRVQTYFSVYNTVPRASPENFISLSWKLVYFAACANSCLRSAEGPPPFAFLQVSGTAASLFKLNEH